MHRKVESRRQSPGAENSTPAASEPSPAPLTTAPSAGVSSGKTRCRGATRYGDPCRFWALPASEFCYWCEQAGRPRYPLPAPTGEAAQAAITEAYAQNFTSATDIQVASEFGGKVIEIDNRLTRVEERMGIRP